MTGIELRTKVFPLAFLLYLFPPKVSIDGGPEVKIKWGVTPIPLPPGQHQVSVWFTYLFYARCNFASLVVDVPSGQVVVVEYKSRWLVFLKGKIAAVGVAQQGAAAAGQPTAVAAGGGQAAGWFPDPSARHEQRYWDGAAWTAHVTDGGVAGTDPP